MDLDAGEREEDEYSHKKNKNHLPFYSIFMREKSMEDEF